jgi:hypothetical protein
MCTTNGGDEEGPRSGLVNSGCLLHMPPNDFYQPTRREAVAYWNAHALWLIAQRKLNEV